MAKKEKNQDKRKWYQLLGDGYKVAKRTYPWVLWALLGVFLLVLGLFILIGFLTGSKIFWIISGIILAPMITLVVYTRLVERAAFHQMEGMPGAAGALISRIRRGWSFSEEPVRFNARTKDMVYRLIGKPGIALVTEGPTGRVNRLVDDEKKLAKRIAPNVPVHVLNVGTDEGQIKLAKFNKSLKRLPKSLTSKEVSVVVRRYDSVSSNALPIPKGIDPMKMRPDRKGLRGR